MKIPVFCPNQSLEQSKEMEFLDLAQFGEGGAGAFWTNPGGTSPWEMHPDCDELLHIIEGKVQLEVLPIDNGPSLIELIDAGSFVVVPKGCWHRQTILEKTKELYLTPGRTLHSMSPDPRAES